ncbi:amidohydrolase family protein [Nisaea sp.]|uniref:amidohydrolase family protein n=1 Tax=Nisaea sp. TaxID=2024842 RepID=UPI003265C106
MRYLLPVLLFLVSSTVVLANDIVITGGRVIDPETGLDAIRNVAIDGDKIVAISEFPLEGDVVIDASGHVVSPGFIDLHAHGQNIGDYRMQVIQGVTTSLELESGVLPIGDWYAGQAQKNPPVNYGASAGWTYSRIATFSETDPLATAAYFQDAPICNDWKMDSANADQSENILSLLE